MTEPTKLRLGGMALANGLLVHGPTHWAAAVRTPAGDIEVASGRKPRVEGVENLPGVRGVVRLGEAMVVVPLVRRALPAARLPFERLPIAGAAVAVTGVATLLRRRAGAGPLTDAAIAGLSLAPALLALSGGETAAYHGVEHKAIAAYEQNRADAADASKEHDRCGSHLMAPLITDNLVGAALMRSVLDQPGPAANAVISLGSVAAAVEVFAWSERHSGSRTARLLRRPGYELQRVLGTREPDERQLEVGRAAMAEILRVEDAPVSAVAVAV